MRTRTRLTTPPGQEPVEEAGARGADRERYSPGFALPTEPDVPSRYRAPLTAVLALLIVAALAYGGFRLATQGQYEDPALTDVPSGQLPGEPLAGSEGTGG